VAFVALSKLTMAKAAPQPPLNNHVFINCPFDDAYWPMFRAIVFTIWASGYRSRCALEANGGVLRLKRLHELIATCDRGVHDLSRIELSDTSGMPRFNMPFELGVAIGAVEFGGSRQRRKLNLVLARKREEWHPAVSDLAGLDPVFHHDKPRQAVEAVRDFLARTPEGVLLPGAVHLWSTYQDFEKDLPALAKAAHHTLEEAYRYPSFVEFVTNFLKIAR
jgi:hypothetical protein